MLQELAKHIMMSVRRPVSRRVMVALISTPTILVDTQVRMLLLRQDNLNVSVAGTILLAIFEIVVRASKSLIVQRQTRRPINASQERSRRWSSVSNALPASNRIVRSMSVFPISNKTPAHDTKSEIGTQSRVYSARSGETTAEYKKRKYAEERRLKVRVLHAGEIHAEMYAEYIAIGCSYVILFFYRGHPQFEFNNLTNSDTTLQNQQLTSLGGLQMGAEIIVDFLSCALEASEGVEFKSFNQNDPFLIFFLTMLTFSNIAISAGMYLR
ncbi:unnamed protein product [Phytophthora fragariaefolia]|uniref:Unnamed protein product n=1 Tax=Phytophthora fragariaefolia TaxID=1490495 RepID=A0A9W7D3P5_9STRA|nr:unnamed protein product [Phytophthora fragariaefolia]